jgi:uncharacterized phage-like protein YoqJ
MPEKDKTCTICGMHPYKLPRGLSFPKLSIKLDREIKRSILCGYTIFQTGMITVTDIWAAEMIIKMKRGFTAARFACFLPCEKEENEWDSAIHERCLNILARADEVIYLQKRYTPGCIQRCNYEMADRSSRLIAIHDGVSEGGAAQTILYARKQGLDVAVINPLDCLQT